MPTRCFMIVFDVFLKELSSRTISGGGRRIAGRVGSCFLRQCPLWPGCCFIKLVLEFFYLIQCIIPLFFCFQGALFHLLELLFRFLLHFFKLQKHIFQYLEPVITDTYRFLMGIRRFFLQFQDPGSILPAFLLMKLFQPDISFSGFQFFISGLCSFQAAQECNTVISIRHTFSPGIVLSVRRR